MKQPQTAPITALPAKPRPISAKVERALQHRVRTSEAWEECAKAAGLSPAGVFKARKKIEVQQRFEEIKAEYIQEVDDMKAPHKARAIEVGRDLLDNSKSEAVRARMVEFFAGESHKNNVNVAVQVNNGPAVQGYEYAHPSQEVVTIRAAKAKDVTPKH